jgi:hypothetical protein
MEINNKLVEALEENCLNQAVAEPTRQDSILVLVLTTNPSIIEHISVEDGMSDHKIEIIAVISFPYDIWHVKITREYYVW